MTGTGHAISDEELCDFVDRRLGADDRARVEEAMIEDPELARKVAAYLTQNADLRSWGEAILDEPVPEHLFRTVRQANQNRVAAPAGYSALAVAATGLVLLVAGSAAGWFGRPVIEPKQDIFAAYVEEAVAAHKLALAQAASESSKTINPSSKGPKTVRQAVFQAPIRVPDAAGDRGLTPVALNRSVGQSGHAINITFKGEESRLTTLYIRQSSDAGKLPTSFTTGQGASALYWVDGPFVYILVSNTDEASLLDFAKSVYEAPAVQDAALELQ